METYFDDITVQQGEDFNMDILVSASNLEYIPFLVTSERPNPHFVVTVASTKYEKNMRYVDSWWNDPVKQAQLPLFWQQILTKAKSIDTCTDTHYLATHLTKNLDINLIIMHILIMVVAQMWFTMTTMNVVFVRTLVA